MVGEIRLEALLLARTLETSQQEPTFQTMKVVTMNTPPVGAVESNKPLIKLAVATDAQGISYRNIKAAL